MKKHPFLRKWCNAVSKSDLPQLLQLYEQDALLKPTLSPEIRSGHAAIERYFTGDEENRGFLHQGIERVHYRVEQELYLDHALVLMGVYEFVTPEKTIKAHFTFVLKESGLGFTIMAQHSSLY